MLGTRDEFGAERVTFDVAKDRGQVAIDLDGECFIAALPDMPRGVALPMVSLGMRRQQPSHPTTKVAVGLRAHDEMKVVRHEAVAQDIQWDMPFGINNGIDKRVIVSRLVKDGLLTVAPVQGVVNHPTDGSTRSSWHGKSVTRHIFRVKNTLRPLFIVRGTFSIVHFRKRRRAGVGV